MRTITKTIEIYKFNELSPLAKDKAISDYAFTDAWSSEYKAVLKDFCERFNVEVWNWEVGAYEPILFNARVKGMENEELHGLRLRTWIINNFWHDLYEGRYYSTPFKQVPKSPEHPAGLSYRFRHSRIIMEERCLTGFCAGYTILGAIREFIDGGWKLYPNKTWEDIVNECVNDFFLFWKGDMEYAVSDEGFEEFCEGNGYEFTADGCLY